VVTDKKSALHWQRRKTILQRLLLAAGLLGTGSVVFSQAPNLSTTRASTTIANLRSDDEKTRQEAARNLFYVCDAAPDLTAVVNGIGPLLLSPDAHVKLAEALGDAAPTDPRAVKVFVSSFDSDLPEVKQAALIALGKSGRAATAALQGSDSWQKIPARAT
jgi:hypothetical protein